MEGGGGSVNTTHLVAFQEQSDKSVQHLEKPQIQHTRKRSMFEPSEQRLVVSNANARKEPPAFSSFQPCIEDESSLSLKYFLWLWLRHQNRFDQIIPNFPGWLLQHRVSQF